MEEDRYSRYNTMIISIAVIDDTKMLRRSQCGTGAWAFIAG